MIIDQPPVDEGAGLIRLVVIDSTSGPHADDSRKDGATGVGRGTLWLQVDNDGRPIGYHWRARNGKLNAATIAIGRVGQ